MKCQEKLRRFCFGLNVVALAAALSCASLAVGAADSVGAEYAVVYPSSATSRYPIVAPIVGEELDLEEVTSAESVSTSSEVAAQPFRGGFGRGIGLGVKVDPGARCGVEGCSKGSAVPPTPEYEVEDVETPLGQVRSALENLTALRVGQSRLESRLGALGREVVEKLETLSERLELKSCATRAASGCGRSLLGSFAKALLPSWNFWKFIAIALIVASCWRRLKGVWKLLTTRLRDWLAMSVAEPSSYPEVEKGSTDAAPIGGTTRSRGSTRRQGRS